jgi:hypothetical protein
VTSQVYGRGGIAGGKGISALRVRAIGWLRSRHGRGALPQGTWQ